MPDSSSKLTKKQRKAADFKAGKGSANKKRDTVPADVPEDDLIGEAADGEQSTNLTTRDSPAAQTSSKKRKREEPKATGEPSTSNGENTPSTSEGTSIAIGGTGSKVSFDEDGKIVQKKKTKRRRKAGSKDDDGKPRLIVFVGNMSFKTTADAIRDHFKTHCKEEPTVRLLTTKSDHSKIASASKLKSVQKGKAADPTIRSKGCAFVQFQTAAALQKALGLHHTQFEGRLINVELTAGGGGSGTERTKKIQEKNAKLEQERSKLHEKYWKPADDQRKATSEAKRSNGEDVGPPRRKAKIGQEGEAQWGRRNKDGPEGASAGQKRKTPRWMASGANAVRLQD